MIIELEIHWDGAWHKLGTVKCLGEERAGIGAATSFEYDLDYAAQAVGSEPVTDYRAASCTLPVSVPGNIIDYCSKRIKTVADMLEKAQED